ncbi:MAG: hypothetical protein WEB87_03110 [Bacteriovoracaceae bacterium]
MSGFGLRAFKKLKEESRKEDKRQYIPHIVVGDNAFAALVYLKLRQKHGDEAVKLVCRNPLDKQDIINQWKCSLHTIRDEDRAKNLNDLNPRLEIFPSQSKVRFYKDAKFHEMDGRAKPHEFMEDEEFFKDSYFHMKKEHLFTTEQWNELDETLRTAQINKYISGIKKTEPKDLVEKTNFILETGERENLECEKLYWCDSPKAFYKLAQNKNDLSDAVAGYCAALEERVGLTVHFEAAQQIYEEQGTVLLPQSATHEWGYFIIDFDKYDPENQKQIFKSMMFIDLDDVNEEELAKKIKLMKRVVGRVFPDFEKAKYTEHLHYNETTLIKNCKDALYFENNGQEEALSFVGIGAPIKAQDSEKFLYDARGIMSLYQLEI